MARHLDLVLLAAALPVFLLAGFPLLGYGAIAVAWLTQRLVQRLVARRIERSADRTSVLGLVGGSVVVRLWIITIPVLVVGLAAEREAGLAAAILAATLVTASLAGEAVHRLASREER